MKQVFRSVSRWSILAAIMISVMLPAATSGQQTSDANKDVHKIVIDIDNPQTKPYQSLLRKTQHTRAFIELKSGGDKLIYVRFARRPVGLDISVAEDVERGYKKGDYLTSGELWYPFKKRLPLEFALASTRDKLPAEYKLEFGELADNTQEPATIQEARMDVRNARDIKVTPLQKNNIIYGQLIDDSKPVISISVNPQRPTLIIDPEKENVSTEQEFTLKETDTNRSAWVFFKISLPNGLQVLPVDTEGDGNSTVEAGKELGNEQWYGFKDSIKLKLRVNPSSDLANSGSPDKTVVLNIEGGVAEAISSKLEAEKAISNNLSVATKGPSVPLTINIQVKEPPNWFDSFITWASEHTLPAILVILAILGLAFGAWLVIANLGARRWMEENNPKPTAPSVPYPAYDYNYSSQPPDSGAGSIRVYKGKRGIWSKLMDWLPINRGGSGQQDPDEAARQHREKQRRSIEEVRYGPSAATAAEPADQATATQVASAQVDASAPVLRPSYASAGPDGRGGAVTVTKIAEIEKQLSDLQSRPDGRELSFGARQEVERMIENQRKVIRSEFQTLLNQQNKQIETNILSINQQTVNDVETRLKDIGRELEKASKGLQGLLLSTGNDHTTYDNRLAKLREELESLIKEKQESNDFFGKLLGLSFEQNVQELREGAFENLVNQSSDTLNRFVKEGVPQAGVLNEFLTKSKAITSSIRSVVDKACAIDQTAEDQLSPYVERAGNLVAELVSLHEQLKNRQLSMVNLNVAISAHPAARYTFLQELGMAIKREIDKLRDPQSYFQNRVERLATSDVIAIADICDKQITKHKPNKELEAALGAMFSSAGLKCIMPTLKQAFNPAEQNLIQIMPGSDPSLSQTVASVESRGFKDGQMNLIRKAGVKVYR
ncbi:MAG TPA: hypothetical protein VKA70_18240 [Blastocatellia bacterium]|nr:hypothetical protein [Blastocatellia bacterium]